MLCCALPATCIMMTSCCHNLQVVSSVVQGVEQLDRKLRAKSPLAEVQPLLDALQQQLAAVVQADQQ